jgi:hypothetical protein
VIEPFSLQTLEVRGLRAIGSTRSARLRSVVRCGLSGALRSLAAPDVVE